MLSRHDIRRMYDAANVKITHPLRALHKLCMRPEMYGLMGEYTRQVELTVRPCPLEHAR